MGVPQQLPQQPGLLHPLTVTSEGIYGAINLRQASLVQPVTTHRAVSFLSLFLQLSAAVQGSENPAVGAWGWAGSPYAFRRPVN